MRPCFCGSLLFAAGLFGLPAHAADDAAASTRDLTGLSLEELSSIEVTSVSKHAEALLEADASVYVISAADIRRSGAASLPEALRLAPNLLVARVNATQYAISARGFNNAIGNKLLVLVDGRTVYTPQFSGVNWDSQLVMLEDVERIEVISGPGGTLWGANAVNGVINVITRPARDTQGVLVAVGGGNRDSAVDARYGGSFGTTGHFRIYGMGLRRENTTTLATGASVADGARDGQFGFRADWGATSDAFTLQGDAYSGKNDPGPAGAFELSGANLLARWTHETAASSWSVQAYYDRDKRDDPFALSDTVDTYDVEFQHGFPVGAAHKVLWGGGARHAVDDAVTHFSAANILPEVFMPSHRALDWSDLWVQDEIALCATVTGTLGIKAERNDYTGVEYLPNARLAWRITPAQLAWAELSRAVRAPARIDRDFYLYLSLPGIPLIPVIPVITGGPNFESEVANVAEIGYRAQPTRTLSYSITGFYDFYDKLRSGSPPPAMVQNQIAGHTSGVEAWGTWQASPTWQLSAGGLWMHEHLARRPGSTDPTGPSALGDDPRYQWMLRSTMEVGPGQELDAMVRRVGPLPDPAVPAYTAVDLRYAWRPRPALELSVSIQNALDPKHVEFGAAASADQIGRSVFVRISWGI